MKFLWINISIAIFISVLSSAYCADQDSPFGIICPWDGVAETGVKWIRVGASATNIDWNAIQKSRDDFDWTNADAEVDRWAVQEQMNLLPIFGYTASWASSANSGDMFAPPTELNDWYNYVYRLVDRYKTKIKYWEVWNEPNIDFWHGSVEQFADLLKTAYVAAKKADPTCKIVFGGTAGIDIPYMELIYAHGCKNYFDIMAIHPYQWGESFDVAWFTSMIGDMYRLMKANGDGHKEIWLTEFGWSTGDSGITEEIQARLLAQCLIASLTMPDLNVTKTFWFSVKDWGGPGHGLLRVDGSRKPAFYAYKFVTDSLKFASFVKSMHNGDFLSYMFSVDNKPVLAVWRKDKTTADYKLPDDFEWTEIRRIDGSVKSVSGLATISIGSEPVFIIGNSKVFPTKRNIVSNTNSKYMLDVWCGIKIPSASTGLYVERGIPYTVNAALYNRSGKAHDVSISASIGEYESINDIDVRMNSHSKKDVKITFMLPDDFIETSSTLKIRGTVGKSEIAPIDMPVKITNGPMISFLANSDKEKRYLFENKLSGAAPSIRFNGSWIYKMYVPSSKSASLNLNVGAHNAGQWSVSISKDNSNWEIGASGKSNRSWHKIEVTKFAGDWLYIKLDGDNQQLSELILNTER